MGYYNYKRVATGAITMMKRSCSGGGGHSLNRGFRVNQRRFSVQRLRSKLFFFFKKIFNRCRSSYGNALRSVRRNMTTTATTTTSSYYSRDADHYGDVINKMGPGLPPPSSASAPYGTNYCRLRYYGRSNSFYSEAIADCLDFIKRNSLSVDDDHHHRHKPSTPVLGQRT